MGQDGDPWMECGLRDRIIARKLAKSRDGRSRELPSEARGSSHLSDRLVKRHISMIARVERHLDKGDDALGSVLIHVGEESDTESSSFRGGKRAVDTKGSKIAPGA
jgi:hypothetical protein